MAAKTLSQSRNNYKVLVVCSNGPRSNQVRSSLKTLGFSQISATASHIEAIDRFRVRPFTHVFFDASCNEMPTVEFVQQLVDLDEDVCLLCVSDEPQVDDVFSLLKAGARHFLVVPFNVDTVEEVLVEASEGPPLSDSVLNAPDRNAALVGVVLNNLYRQTVLMRQSREYPTAARELENQTRKLMQSIDMARMFVDGTEDDLVEAMVEGCIARANVAASRLGRTRKRLREKRLQDDGAQAPNAS